MSVNVNEEERQLWHLLNGKELEKQALLRKLC